eukprot:6213583-Pleurochrysis_carterae.AAC.2
MFYPGIFRAVIWAVLKPVPRCREVSATDFRCQCTRHAACLPLALAAPARPFAALAEERDPCARVRAPIGRGVGVGEHPLERVDRAPALACWFANLLLGICYKVLWTTSNFITVSSEGQPWLADGHSMQGQGF